MVKYIYNHKRHYLEHMEKLIEQGYRFGSNCDKERYSGYFNDYDDFALYLDNSKILSYGSVKSIECKLIEYKSKSSNKIFY